MRSWTADTWIFPALLLLHPERAKSLVMFRSFHASGPRKRVPQAVGLKGAKYPWEADPEMAASRRRFRLCAGRS